MSSANVLLTAPEYVVASLYPQLQPDFRMQTINEISAALNSEVSLRKLVAKKYKRAKKFVNWSAAGSQARALGVWVGLSVVG